MNSTRRQRLARVIAAPQFIQQGSKLPPQLMSWWQAQDASLKQGKNALGEFVQFIDSNSKSAKDPELLADMKGRAIKVHDGLSNVSMNIPGVLEAVYPQYARPDPDSMSNDYAEPNQSQVETGPYYPPGHKTPKSKLTPSQMQEAQQPTEIRRPALHGQS